jgi:hypothetical protein
MSIQGLQRLEVWRKAKDFAVIIHQEESYQTDFPEDAS